MKKQHAGLAWTVVRWLAGASAVVLAVAVGVVALSFRYGYWDGSPDDRLLAAMQQIASSAQTVLDETGDVPTSLDDLSRATDPATRGHQESPISYQRLQSSGVRLCATFSTASSGQQVARPFFDVFIPLQPALAAPRPAAGRHCYDVTLEVTDPEIREDALLFRDLDAAATAAECAFAATGRLPSTTPPADDRIARQLGDPACDPRRFIGRAHQDIEYAPEEPARIRLCGTFHRGYDASGKPARMFDPRRDARFDELAQTRPETGRRCYAIAILLPDPKTEMPASAWDQPIDTEKLPTATRGAATQDRRMIGDAVNLLRLARCALSISGTAPASIKDAIKTVASRPRIAERYKCDWVPTYYAESYNFPVTVYQRMDDEHVRVCARFQMAWDQPLALGFYREALVEWPTSLPELQQPIPKPGEHCFAVRLTPIGSGAV